MTANRSDVFHGVDENDLELGNLGHILENRIVDFKWVNCMICQL